MSDRPNGAAGAAADAPAVSGADAAGHVPEGRVGRQEHTEHEVAGVLAGLLDGPEDEDEGEAGSDSADTGDGGDEDDVAADESPPSDEDDGEAENETGDSPSIEPPAAWTAQDREEWAKVPPAAQAIIARRETELTGTMTRATQEAASLYQVAAQDRSQYVTNLGMFRDVLLPEARQLENIDWPRLATENPAEFVRLTAQKEAMRERFAAIHGEIGRIQQVSAQQQQQQLEAARTEGRRRLMEAMPEFADEAKAKQIGQELGEFLRGQGYADHEIAGVVDARAVVLAVKLMRYEQADQARKAAVVKRANTAPQVQRPGNSQQRSNGVERTRTQYAERLKRTGSIRDAAGLLETWLPR